MAKIVGDCRGFGGLVLAPLRQFRKGLLDLRIELVELTDQLVVACVESVQQFTRSGHGGATKVGLGKLVLHRHVIDVGNILARVAAVACRAGYVKFDVVWRKLRMIGPNRAAQPSSCESFHTAKSLSSRAVTPPILGAMDEVGRTGLKWRIVAGSKEVA